MVLSCCPPASRVSATVRAQHGHYLAATPERSFGTESLQAFARGLRSEAARAAIAGLASLVFEALEVGES
jgi:hypothetical protein